MKRERNPVRRPPPARNGNAQCAGLLQPHRRVAEQYPRPPHVGVCGSLFRRPRRIAQTHVPGAEDLAVYTKKGASPRGHDHRGRCTEMLDTCVSNTSTIEATAGADPVDGLPIEAVKNRFDAIDVSRFVGQINGRRQFDDSLGVCRFDSQDLMLELHTFNAVTGLNYEPLDALRKGRQIVHLMRAFNARHGLTADMVLQHCSGHVSSRQGYRDGAPDFSFIQGVCHAV